MWCKNSDPQSSFHMYLPYSYAPRYENLVAVPVVICHNPKMNSNCLILEVVPCFAQVQNTNTYMRGSRRSSPRSRWREPSKKRLRTFFVDHSLPYEFRTYIQANTSENACEFKGDIFKGSATTVVLRYVRYYCCSLSFAAPSVTLVYLGPRMRQGTLGNLHPWFCWRLPSFWECLRVIGVEARMPYIHNTHMLHIVWWPRPHHKTVNVCRYVYILWHVAISVVFHVESLPRAVRAAHTFIYSSLAYVLHAYKEHFVHTPGIVYDS